MKRTRKSTHAKRGNLWPTIMAHHQPTIEDLALVTDLSQRVGVVGEGMTRFFKFANNLVM